MFIFECVLKGTFSHSEYIIWILHVLQWISPLQRLVLEESASISILELVTGKLVELHVEDWSLSISLLIEGREVHSARALIVQILSLGEVSQS